MVYDQCLQEVQDKLKSTDNWERAQQEQSLYKLIQKIERVCMGFDNHKQEVLTWFKRSRCYSCTCKEKRTPWKNLGATSKVFG